MDEYVLTDKDHHDMALMEKVPIYQFLTFEPPGTCLFILRKKNRKMKELIASQKEGILLVSEEQKEVRIRDEFKRIFDHLTKSKPGIKVRRSFYKLNLRPMKILLKRTKVLLTLLMAVYSTLPCFLPFW
mgnify:CR=1 FL=1|jgi:hypothetical protein